MSLTAILFFLPVCFALNMTFGPNNLLSVTNGIHHSVRFAMIAALGRLAAFVPMMALAGLGMGALLETSELAFNVVKVAGVVYLLWIGIKLCRSGAAHLKAGASDNSLGAAMKKECLVAASNPKAILIFTAFLPQFVDPSNYAVSFTIVSAIFLCLEWVCVGIYATLGKVVGTRLIRSVKATRIFNWCSGGVMIAFAGLLATLRRPA